ncbi:hypothetical protein IJ21_14590 [Paenibacillus sp. 32O-W]|uniref:hypothetical protein n=1 Tax=Paenibacillus sp. 32O-W TaxID=1695218 RepID=UPI000721A66B|nr:hypothetical protein [Paenibacillus sp. 32O-W]ALS26863.1 hypothetical protein IJ21_14590 [Paenibacillus sp. 32O-W]
MWYWILWGILAVWTFFDARKRKNNAIGWTIGVFLIGPIALPIYFAKRNLKDKEIREGGTAWNVLKNFALFWTLTMAVIIVAGMMSAGEVIDDATNGAEQAGAIIGAGLGVTMLIVIWFIIMVIALILGFFLKKSSIVEKGPTGQLAAQKPVTP